MPGRPAYWPEQNPMGTGYTCYQYRIYSSANYWGSAATMYNMYNMRLCNNHEHWPFRELITGLESVSLQVSD